MKALNYLKYSIVALAIIATTASCKKDRTDEEEEQPKTEYTSLDKFYEDNKPEEQTFIIDTTKGDSIVGKEGTVIKGIPKEIYMYKSNQQDIVYPYELRLIEAYSFKNMIFSKLPTIAQGKLMTTGGEIKVTAFKDNQELVIKENMGLYMMAPSVSPINDMKVYYGFTKGTTNDWNNNVTLTDYLFSQDNVTLLANTAKGYQMKIAKLGWTSPAKEYSYTSKTNITFTADGINTNFLDIYAIIPSQHSFAKVSNMTLTDMPVGETVKVFSMGKDTKGKMYYSLQTITVAANQTVNIVMQESTEANVLSIISGL